MENKSRSINIYGALGSALIVSVLIVGLIFLVLSTTSAFSRTSSDSSIFLGLSFIGLLLALFGILPILLTSRYGWKTVLSTILVQSILIFFTLFIVGLVTGSKTSDSCSYNYSSSHINEGVSAPRDYCY